QVRAHHGRGPLGPERQPPIPPVHERVHLLRDDVARRPRGASEQLGGLEDGGLDVPEPVDVRQGGGTVVEGTHLPTLRREQVVRARDRLELHQTIPRRNGFDARSRPTVVSGPWPGRTRRPSGSVRNRVRLRTIASGSELAKSDRPIVPANTRSPER